MNDTMTYEQICHGLNITLTRIEPGDEHCQSNGERYYLNRSSRVGDEIFLGIYANEELEAVSFFHELTHILHQGDEEHDSVFAMEKYLWGKTFEVAKQYGREFGDAAHVWAGQQLLTYFKPEYL